VGVRAEELERSGIRVDREPGVRLVGRLPADAYRTLLARARVFVTAPRREDYGIAQLEALAAGCMLATTPAPGPYLALEIARDLDPRLVSGQLAQALRTALLDPVGDYAQRAIAALAPLRPAAVDAIVADRLAPRLLRQAS
jgi:glycosyltransferase involved in cell wall biosynthesis